MLLNRVAPSNSLQMVVEFALSQSLIEALAQGEIVLLLGALKELFDLPSAWALGLLALQLAVSGLSRLGGLGGLRLLLSGFAAPTTTEQSR